MIVTPRFWPQSGGEAAALARLAVRVVDQGGRVTVWTEQSRPTLPVEANWRGVRIVRVPPADWLADDFPPFSMMNLLFRNAVGRFLSQFERFVSALSPSDIVYTCGLGQMAYMATDAALRCGARSILRPTLAGLSGDCFRQIERRDGQRLKKSLLEAHAFVAPTRGLERELIAAGYPRDRIHYIPNGASPLGERTVKSRVASRATLIDSLPILRGDVVAPVVLWHGEMTPESGLSILIEAWAQVVAQFPTAVLWLVGLGPEWTRVQKLLEKKQLDASVRMLGEFDDVEDFMVAADIYAAPATDEDTCGELIEAMNCGMPIVASDIPGHRGFLEHQREGLLVAAESADALAQGLVSLLADSCLSTELGARALARAEAELSMYDMFTAHAGLFSRLAAEPPHRPFHKVAGQVRRIRRKGTMAP